MDTTEKKKSTNGISETQMLRKKNPVAAPSEMPAVQMGKRKHLMNPPVEMPSAQMDKRKHSMNAPGEMPSVKIEKQKIRIGQLRPHVMDKPGEHTAERIIERSGKQFGQKVGFDYPATLMGSTTHFNVYYDPGLGTGGQTIAAGVLASCEGEYNYLQTQFGGISAGPFNIIIAAGIGGAYHWGCAAVDLYCDADTSATPDVDHTRLLVVAEEVEVFSAVQAMGWDCGASNGEGLSRVLATELYAAELNGFNSASTWLDGGRPDFVNVNDPTDRSYVSTGCSVLFLNYLHYQLGFSWQQIVAAAAPTLAQTYTILTGRTDGYNRFKALLQQHLPEGTPSGLTNDNPFPFVVVDSWSGWYSLGGVIMGNIAIENNADGRMEMFAEGTDGAVWHQWQVVPNGDWSGWNSLGGVIIGNIAVENNADGRLEIFVKGTDGAVWHQWQVVPNGDWSGWYSLGGVITSDITVENNADGRLEIFARGTDNAVWHQWQVAPNGDWSGWYSLGGIIMGNIAVETNADGRLEIFASGTDNAVWHQWQIVPNGDWSGWYSLGGVIMGNIAVENNADGRLEIFAEGTDGAVWHQWQVAPNGDWSGWYSLGGVITSDISVENNADGRLEIFAQGTDGAVWHQWQVVPNGNWSGWYSLGGVITSDIAVENNDDGRLEIFARGTDNAVWHQWQTGQ